jgi:hypothetical protein
MKFFHPRSTLEDPTSVEVPKRSLISVLSRFALACTNPFGCSLLDKGFVPPKPLPGEHGVEFDYCGGGALTGKT